LPCEDFWRKARKQNPRIVELCAGSADVALRQKDRKATSFYARREYITGGGSDAPGFQYLRQFFRLDLL